MKSISKSIIAVSLLSSFAVNASVTSTVTAEHKVENICGITMSNDKMGFGWNWTASNGSGTEPSQKALAQLSSNYGAKYNIKFDDEGASWEGNKTVFPSHMQKPEINGTGSPDAVKYGWVVNGEYVDVSKLGSAYQQNGVEIPADQGSVSFFPAMHFDAKSLKAGTLKMSTTITLTCK